MTNIKIPSTKSVTLVLTHQCNLRCYYCYEKNKDNVTMTLEKAKEILDKELYADDGIENVEIDLFGGEPLLEYETIKSLIEYARTQKYPKDYIFFITTNGTCLNDEMKEWLSKNTDLLQIGLSLDGTREMHNINRCNSFDKIDLDFFKNNYPQQYVKMTISDKTLPDLCKGIVFCHEKGFEVSCNLAYGIDWSSKENKIIFEQQLMMLMDYYIKHPDVKPCAMLNIDRLKSMTYVSDINVRYCGAGYAMKAYDCDGEYYPCQHFLPLSIGKELAKKSLSIDFSSYKLEDEVIEKKCRDCVIRNLCPTCYGENFSSTGNIHKRNENMCELFKIQFKALSYFASLLFQNNLLSGYSSSDIAAILKSALIINENIQL